MSRMLIASLAAAALILTACGQTAEQTAENPAEADRGQQEVAPAQERASSAAPARRQAPAMMGVPDGTTLDVRLETSLNSGKVQVGQSFTAEVIEPVMIQDRVAIPAGSTLHGRVESVKAAKRGAGNASMTLVFTSLELPGGYSTEVTASLSRQSASKKKRNAAIIGGSAAGGALLGRVLGKDTKGAVVGSIVGGAVGTGVVLAKEGEQVNLPEGTEMSVQLEQGIKVPRG